MSYRVGTPHYNLPQTEGSDTRDWFDTNEAFADIDAAIFSAGQTAEAAQTDLTEVKNDVQGLKDADIAMTGRVDGIDTRLGTAELKIDRLQDEVIDDNQDLKDAICSIEEASATAAYAHATGEFFWYNDTLYKAATNIAIGQQIVPDTNCKTTNITTELLAGGGGGGAEIDDTVISASKVWSSYKTNEEITTASAVKTGDTRWYSGKIQYYDGSAWVDAEIGGPMKVIEYGVATGTQTVTFPSGVEIDPEDYTINIYVNATLASGGGSGTAYYGMGVYVSSKTSTGFTISGDVKSEYGTYPTYSYECIKLN